jgi:adenylate cyclase
MQFRIGVNLGDVIAEGDRLYGTGVNVAVRLQQLAEAGGIFISQTVYDQVRKIVGIPFEDVGERHLKNITDPVHVYRILPAPPTPLHTFLWRIRRSPGLGAAAAVAVLLVVLGGSFLLRQPAALWDPLLGVRGALPENPSIAVLPFQDMSATRDQQYLADGITEELIMGLAKFPDFVVMARNSTFTYKDKPTDVRQVGRDLNVRYVLEGSIQRANQQVRVTAQLIDATTGRHIWADRYDRQVDNIFAIRDDITRSIAGTLGSIAGVVTEAEASRVSAKDPSSFTAYDYLMKGWDAYNKFTREDNAAARGFFEQAMAIDPNYARAYAGLAWTHELDYDFEWTEDDAKSLKLALDNSLTAVRLDPNDIQAQWGLGWAYLYNRQFDRAMTHYARARKLNPNDAEVLAEMGNLLIYVGQPKQALEQVQEAIRLNPNHYEWYVYYVGWAYEEAGMPEQSIEVFEKAIDLQNPDEEQLWYLPTVAAAYAELGRMDDARKVVETVLSREPDFSIAKKVARYPYKTKELTDRYANALRRAGFPE